MSAEQTATNKPTLTSKRPISAGPDATASTQRLLTSNEAAARLGCSRSMIYKLVRSRDLPAIHLGKIWRFDPDEVERYVGRQNRTARHGVRPARPKEAEEKHILFVRSAKGAPLSILFALGWAGIPLSCKELIEWTHYGHTQVTTALRWLVRSGWVSGGARGPWRLVSAHQVPALHTHGNESALSAPNSDDNDLEEQQIPNKPLTPSDAKRAQVMKALHECGIWEPTATRLANLPHVTPEYVRAHAAQARAEGLRVGAAIVRIEMGAPLPPKDANKARSRQLDVEEKIRRFVEG